MAINPHEKPLIIFEADADPYHISQIRQGIRDFFKKNDTPFQYCPLSWNDIKRIHSSNKIEVGVIGWWGKKSMRSQLEERGIPYLNLYESEKQSNLDLKLAFKGEGTIAADFFIDEMHFENLAFVGLDDTPSSDRRLHEYQEQAKRKNIIIHNRPLQNEKLLQEIPKPAGFFCANDKIALSIYYTALAMNFSVPEDISIIGVGGMYSPDNLEMNNLSIVQLDHFNQGWMGVSMLIDHLSGNKKSQNIKLIPDGITHRKTTINNRIDDLLVKKAFDLIREDSALCVDDICQRLQVSRRALEKRFRIAANTTLAQAIDFERFNKAKMLIKTVSYNQESIAGLAGYANREQMRRSFYRFAKMNPRQYRRDYIESKTTSVD